MWLTRGVSIYLFRRCSTRFSEVARYLHVITIVASLCDVSLLNELTIVPNIVRAMTFCPLQSYGKYHSFPSHLSFLLRNFCVAPCLRFPEIFSLNSSAIGSLENATSFSVGMGPGLKVPSAVHLQHSELDKTHSELGSRNSTKFSWCLKYVFTCVMKHSMLRALIVPDLRDECMHLLLCSWRTVSHTLC